MSDRPFDRCTVCGNLLGASSDGANTCRRCGTRYDEMPEKEEREIF